MRLSSLFAPLSFILACGGAPAPAEDPKTATTPSAAVADASAPPASPAAKCTGKSYVVLRHAEKGTDDPKNPSLSDKGKARAKVIAAMLNNMKVTRLIASQFKRTQETLAPLAEKFSLPVEVRDASKMADLVTELRAAPDGSLTVIAGHSNTVPALVKELGGGKLENLDEKENIKEEDFSRLILIKQPCDGPATTMQMNSGD